MAPTVTTEAVAANTTTTTTTTATTVTTGSDSVGSVNRLEALQNPGLPQVAPPPPPLRSTAAPGLENEASPAGGACHVRLAVRAALQFACNYCVGSQENQALLWEAWFPRGLMVRALFFLFCTYVRVRCCLSFFSSACLSVCLSVQLCLFITCRC